MTRCPKCQSNLSITGRGESANEASCPRCRTVFTLRELGIRVAEKSILDEGTLVSVSAGTAEPTETSNDANTANHKSVVRRRRYYSRARLPKNLPPVKLRRRKRKRRTTFTRVDFLKVVFGGLMALPVAQLILWWGFAKDPFAFGPKVAKGIPFVVPLPFRGEEPVPQAETPKYVANPETSLLPGRPFGFTRSPSNINATQLQRGMVRSRTDPLGNSANPQTPTPSGEEIKPKLDDVEGQQPK